MDEFMLPEYDSGAVMLFYWLPFGLCTIGYTLHIFSRLHNPHERQQVTRATIVGCCLFSAVPVLNLFTLFFDVLPLSFPKLSGKVGEWLNTPLIRKHK